MSEFDEPMLSDAFGASFGEDGPNPALRERIRTLMTEQPYAVLCTQGGGQPYGSVIAFAANPELAKDPRFTLYPKWMRDQVVAYASGRPPAFGAGGDPDAPGKMVMDIFKAGGRIVAGTDSPNGINLHGELSAYVKAGMTP